MFQAVIRTRFGPSRGAFVLSEPEEFLLPPRAVLGCYRLIHSGQAPLHHPPYLIRFITACYFFHPTAFSDMLGIGSLKALDPLLGQGFR